MAVSGSGMAARTLHRSRRPIAFVIQPRSAFGAHRRHLARCSFLRRWNRPNAVCELRFLRSVAPTDESKHEPPDSSVFTTEVDNGDFRRAFGGALTQVGETCIDPPGAVKSGGHYLQTGGEVRPSWRCHQSTGFAAPERKSCRRAESYRRGASTWLNRHSKLSRG